MPKNIKRFLCLVLALIMILPVLAGCGKQEDASAGTKPAPTEPEEEAKVLKVLTLGHSLAVNTGHMLNMIAHAEGFEDLVVGTLYYSGCPLYKHVEYMTKDEPAYNLYLSSTETPTVAPITTDGVTMKYALTYDYWDIIVMQGGVFEVAKDETYTDGNIQKIQEYVNKHKLADWAVFAWHMPWAFPTDDDLRKSKGDDNYITNYEPFNHDRLNFYKAMTGCVEKYIMTDDTFEFLIPSGTAIECAVSSYLTEKELFRDYAHANDLGILISGYLWYCKLAGVEHLEELKVTSVPKQFLRTKPTIQDWVLTDAEKAIILEAVNNALKEPLKLTESQYKQAPVANAG